MGDQPITQDQETHKGQPITQDQETHKGQPITQDQETHKDQPITQDQETHKDIHRKMYNTAELENAIPIGSQPRLQRSNTLLSPVVTMCTGTCSITDERLHIDAP